MTGRSSTWVAKFSLATLALFCWSSAGLAADVLLNGGLENGSGPSGWTLTQTMSTAPTGDYNGNGAVDSADYALWRSNPAGYGGSPAGYDTWRANFGSTGGGGGSPNAYEQLDAANYPDLADGQLGLLLKPFAGNTGQNIGLNGKVSVVLEQTYNYGTSAAGRTYTFSGYSHYQLNASNNLDTLFDTSPSGAIPSPTQTYFEVAFLNASNQVLGAPTRVDLPKNRVADAPVADTWQQTVVSALAPAGTTKVRLRAAALDMVDSCGDSCSNGQDVFFDNFTLRDSVTPSLERIVNGNFDIPGQPTNWTLIKTAQDNVQFSTADYARHSGNVGMWLRAWMGGDAKIQQTVAGTAGQQYQYSGWAKLQPGYNGITGTVPGTTTFMTMEFLDGLGTLIGSPVSFDLQSLTWEPGEGEQLNQGVWQHITLPTTTAPAGTASIRVTAGAAGMANGGYPIPQSAMYDEFSLIQVGAGTGNLLADFAVPEPATLCLMLAGFAGSLSIRRRS